MITIELTPQEATLIHAALKCWVNEPTKGRGQGSGDRRQKAEDGMSARRETKGPPDEGRLWNIRQMMPGRNLNDSSTANGEWRMANGHGLTPFQAASLAMADAIGAHELDLREWLVLDLVRRLSYGAGRCEAYIESLSHFAVATRISKGNISRILGRLKRCLVIEERPEFFYGFLHPVANWKLSQRVEQIEVIRQLDLIEVPAHLSGAMRESFVEQFQIDQGRRGRSSASHQRHTNQTHPPGPARGGDLAIPIRGPDKPRAEASSSADASYAGVPESGTFFSGAVPESGTGSVREGGKGGALQQCKIALKEHCYIANNKFDPVPTVPESGTGCEVRDTGTVSLPGSVRFDAERQELFDELERLGAFAAADPSGKVDKTASRGCWFGMVRDRPAIVRELIGELKYRLQQGRTVSSAGAFMMFTWQKWGRPNR